MDAVLRIRQHEIFLNSRTRVELDQAMRIAAVGQPHVSVVIEPYILTCASADESGLQILVLGSMITLTRRIRRQVILDVHGLAELRFVQRHFLVDPHGARLRIRTEVLDQIRKQVLAVLPVEAQGRSTVVQKSFGV